jgi:tetratricopeptide (TPR) repeat protein
MPENLNQLIESALKEKQEGHYEAAYGVLKRILSDIGLDEATELMVLSSEGAVQFNSAERNRFLLESNIRSQIVDLLRKLHRPQEALNHALLAFYIDRFYLGNHNNTAASSVDIGLVCLELQKPELARRYFDESSRIDGIILKEDPNNEFANWRSNARASGYEGLGNILEALHELEKGLPVIRSVMADRQSVVIALNDYSQHLQNLGEHNKAEEVIHEAIEEQRKLGLADHPQFGILYSNLASIYLERGQFNRAKEWLNIASNFSDMVSQRIVLLDQARCEADMGEKMVADITAPSSEFPPVHDYFISHNVNDEEKVNQLKAEMNLKGAYCWTFKENSDWQRPREYQTIMEEMRAEIGRSHALLVVASGTSLTSSCVYDEIDFAWQHKKPVLVWYPEGTRVRPHKAAERADDSMLYLMTVTQKLFSHGVCSYYGAGIRNSVIEELSDSLLYRLLLMVKHHRLHAQYHLEGLRDRVRHATKMIPYFIDEDGKRMFID